MAETPESVSSTTDKLLDAAARVLAPLVRLLIARGVTFQMASELLKRVYVRAAQKHFSDDDATGTQLSLLTGLNRKEIRRLTDSESENGKQFQMTSYAAAVFETWRTQRRWRGRNGKPMLLPRRAPPGKLSFDELVKSVTTDHRPAAVLQELIRLAIVTMHDDDHIALSASAFVPQQKFEDQVAQLAEGVQDHLNAAVTNVLEVKPRFLERMVFSDELSTSSANDIHTEVRKHWQRVHDDVVEKAIAADSKDQEDGAVRKTRIRVGMYFYSESEENE